jgi:hypothetical protein
MSRLVGVGLALAVAAAVVAPVVYKAAADVNWA